MEWPGVKEKQTLVLGRQDQGTRARKKGAQLAQKNDVEEE